MIRALTRLKPCSGRSRTCRRAHFYSWCSNYTQTSTAQPGPTKPAQHNQAQPNQHSTIRPNQITQLQKQHYIVYWKDATKIQKKMELYLQLKRDYKPAEYLSCVKDHKLRKTLTKYRLSDHCLAIERGRHRQRWQPREQRLCLLCSQKELETEEHFLLHCDYYHHIRAAYLPTFKLIQPNFMALPNTDKLSHILGENSKTIATAARYVSACHKRRLSASGQT